MNSLRNILIIFVILVLQVKPNHGLNISAPTSFSNPEECLVTKLDLSLHLDFKNLIVRGRVDLEVKKKNPSVRKLFLDVGGLRLIAVELLHESKATSLRYEFSPEVKNFGSSLYIFLPQTNEVVLVIRIKYETSRGADGLHWLRPDQTQDKKMPFVFSQFETVYARTIVPCQDSPDVRTPYTAEISVPRGMTVLMNGIQVGEPVALQNNRIRYKFEQKIPIPAHLIAIAAGNLVSHKLGPRSHVWAEPSLIGKAAHEFAEIETILKTAEDICGPYVWRTHDVVVIPSNPVAAMENPGLTFTSPTVLAGDRSLVYVLIHSIAHSWSANLITSKDYDHWWLNEGFATFIERKIQGRIRGQKMQDFAAYKGFAGLQGRVRGYGEQNSVTKLAGPKDIHPDIITGSLIVHEKGSFFLQYLEKLVGGAEKFEPFLKYYYNKYKHKSIDTNDFKNTFIEWFEKKGTTEIKDIDWDRWLYAPGMPPVEPNYDMTLANVSIALRGKWKDWDCEKPNVFSPNDLKIMNTQQKFFFLQLIVQLDPMPLCKLQEMEKIYKMNCFKQEVMKVLWILIGLKARWMPKVDEALKFVTETQQMAFLMSLYQRLYLWDEFQERAIDSFKKNRQNMLQATVNVIKDVFKPE